MYNAYCGKIIEKRLSLLDGIKNKLNIFNINVERCSFNNLCQCCHDRKRYMCQCYHLNRSPSTLFRGLKCYFKNVPEHIIFNVQHFDSPRLERDMRTYFEDLYINNHDDGHDYFKNTVLADSSLVTDSQNDVALSRNNYWLRILYMVIIRKFKTIDNLNNDFNYLNLSIKTNNISYNNRYDINGIKIDYTRRFYVRKTVFSISNIQTKIESNIILDFFTDYLKFHVIPKFNDYTKKLDNYDLYVSSKNKLYWIYIINSLSLIFKLTNMSLRYLCTNNRIK